MNTPRGAVLLGVWATVIVAATATGLYLLGSPGDERARRLDIRRVADMQALAAAADVYWSRHSRLPTTLEELRAEPGITISTVDPASGQTYPYQMLDSLRYEVCAAFERESAELTTPNSDNLWAHPTGLHCFEMAPEEIRRRQPSR